MALSSSAFAEEEPAPPEVAPIAPSQHQGHIKIGLNPAMLVIPYGRLGSGLSLGDVARTGIAFGGDISYGLGHSVELGAYGDWARFGQPSDCKGCEVSAISLGLFAKSYLVQGLKIAPWLSYGAGARFYSVSAFTRNNGNYTSLEWLRLGLGFDWYGSSQIGGGTFIQLSAAQVLNRPDGYTPSDDIDRKNGAEGRFTAGLRFFFDFPGRSR